MSEKTKKASNQDEVKQETFNPATDDGDYIVQVISSGKVLRQMFVKNSTIQIMRVGSDTGLIATIQ